jgi:hypothetical protein
MRDLVGVLDAIVRSDFFTDLDVGVRENSLTKLLDDAVREKATAVANYIINVAEHVHINLTGTLYFN